MTLYYTFKCINLFDAVYLILFLYQKLITQSVKENHLTFDK